MKTRDEEIANWKETSRVAAATTLERGGPHSQLNVQGRILLGTDALFCTICTILHDLLNLNFNIQSSIHPNFILSSQMPNLTKKLK